MKYLKKYEAKTKKEPVPNKSYTDFIPTDHEEQIFLGILDRNGFWVKKEMNIKAGVELYWFGYKSDLPDIYPKGKIWNFSIGYILNLFVNMSRNNKIPVEITIKVVDELIDYYLPKHPKDLNNLLKYMSGKLKRKYASMITGDRFDL